MNSTQFWYGLSSIVLAITVIIGIYNGVNPPQASSLEQKPTSSKESVVIHKTLVFPPYWELEGGQVTGLHAKLTRRIYQQAGLNVRFQILPYERIIRNITAKDTAIISYGDSPETNNLLYFPVPSTNVALHIYSLKPNPPTDVEQLKGATIVVQRSFPLADFVDILDNPNYNVVKLDTVAQTLKFFLSGRADYLIILAAPIEKAIQKLNVDKNLIYTQQLQKLDGYPIAVPISHPRALELHQRIQVAYQQLQQQGVIGYRDDEMLLTEDFD
ncbi:substrate-binding periplasmic protein [Marinibactrum halimedae]|uniref:Solute-binding protein family 3/N-terminal domain-containing protein n=1 Tax=Marinibactrum halimedae TaxID=1444977 RepID=A0AA37T661_9GAMM|nr:transporter substrate-binding domain-containing protein [Marinibactrum halimedae]MCD9460933.1 transporter substrate-binding domain-containing protein [Marinibactrum halimedae]GLS27404.1 hypothetical protein GCM10007877_31230 [Marinibactrum halimedae]